LCCAKGRENQRGRRGYVKKLHKRRWWGDRAVAETEDGRNGAAAEIGDGLWQALEIARWVVTSYDDRDLRSSSHFASDQRWIWEVEAISLQIIDGEVKWILIRDLYFGAKWVYHCSVNNWSSKYGLVQNFYITVRFNINSVHLS